MEYSKQKRNIKVLQRKKSAARVFEN